MPSHPCDMCVVIYTHGLKLLQCILVTKLFSLCNMYSASSRIRTAKQSYYFITIIMIDNIMQYILYILLYILKATA